MSKRLRFLLLYGLPLACLVALAGGGGFDLPGTQPGQLNEAPFQSAELCEYCHGNYDVAVEPYFNWRGSMMSQSARDPLFRAALTIAEQDVPGSGQFCWRCHAPTAWLEQRSEPPDGSNFNEMDWDGVQCDVCHRMVDPLSDEGKQLVEPDVPGYGNSMYVMSLDTAKRGPRNDAQANHEWVFSPFHHEGQLCGVCHDVSNPLQASDPYTQKPYEYGPILRVFSEWELSDYAQMGEEGSCQHCHMHPKRGKSCYRGPEREDLAWHSLVGGNYWIPEILPMFWDYSAKEWDALWAGRNRALQTLRRAAQLSVVPTPAVSSNKLTIRVTNRAGHKLPTGDPEARRMWLHVQFFDSRGRLLGESGAYDFATGEIIPDAQLKVYEAKPGIEGQGPSFHMLLNNTYFKDNRIPPKGFHNQRFAERKMAPVGAHYADGQYWDDTTYQLPQGTARVRATLYYQTVRKEYIEFLRNENRTDNWGERLYQAWLATNKCPPVPIATLVWPRDRGIPTAPRKLTATALSASRIRLIWQPARDTDAVVYYEIYRWHPEERRFKRVGVTARAETEFLDVGLLPNTRYTYYVRAVDTSQMRSIPSNQSSATTLE